MRRRVALVLAGAGVAVAAAAIAVVLALRQHSGGQRAVTAGAPAPQLAATAVRGGEVDLARLRGDVVLLSFVDLRADTNENLASRAQIVFLRSMHTQHTRFGLRVVLVDTARQRRNDLVNDTYDWNLDPSIAVVADRGALARRFDVHRSPTTFLIGRGGVVRKRWDRFVPAAQLDFAIRALERRGATG